MAAKYWHRLAHESALWQKGLTQVAGVDEAGCGPLAGPVTAAAVVFPCNWLQLGLPRQLRGLNDSKQLDPEQREKFFQVIASERSDPHLCYIQALASNRLMKARDDMQL